VVGNLRGYLPHIGVTYRAWAAALPSAFSNES
jgi:hypothetical protein